MIARVCLGLNGRSCGRIVEAPQRRCPEHQTVHNRSRTAQRGSREARGYEWGWRQISVRRRRRYPLCEIELPGCTRFATEVDHRIPLRAGGRSTWGNAQSTCRSCNNAKRAIDLGRWPLSEYPEGAIR